MKLDERARLPFKAYPSDAGWDVHALITTKEGNSSKIMVPSRSTRLIRTGLALRPPPGHVILCCSRSGMARDRTIFVANAPGVVDPDYTGEISVILFNGGFEPYWVEDGERIAQVVVIPLPSIELVQIDRMPETERADSGFGSSGKK